jgi:hypothetical protein
VYSIVDEGNASSLLILDLVQPAATIPHINARVYGLSSLPRALLWSFWANGSRDVDIA